MDKRPELGANASAPSPPTAIGSRFFDLNKSFKFAIRSLLTSCSKEEFNKAFSSFTNTEKELLHRLFLQIITSLHETIEDDFELTCLQTKGGAGLKMWWGGHQEILDCLKAKVGATLDAVEEIVEKRELDLLFSDRSNIMDVAENLSTAKKNEIQHLMHMVQLGEEHNQMIHNRLQLLREGKQVLSDASQPFEKFRSMNLSYRANSRDGIRDV